MADEATGKHDHQAVPEVLDLGPARFGYGLAQHGKVCSTQLVGDIGQMARCQLRRAHHVGEQDRHVLGRQRAPSRMADTTVGEEWNG